MRLAANTGCRLHLIEPMGFGLDDKRMRRAGLDYHEFSEVAVWRSFDALRKHIANERPNERPNAEPLRCFMLSTHHERLYSDAQFKPNDLLVFGAETHGLPLELRESVPISHRLRLPMMAQNRSLNLSNSVAIVVYEAWRQQHFAGSKDRT